MIVATPSLSELEQKLARLIAPRGPALLRELAAHVAIPTGHNFQPGLDRYRDVLIERLRAMGAAIKIDPGEAQPRVTLKPIKDNVWEIFLAVERQPDGGATNSRSQSDPAVFA